MTTAPIISRLRRAGGCTKPWRMLTVIETEIAVSSQVLVTPRKLRKVIQSSGITIPEEMTDSELLAEVGRALQHAKIDEAA